MNDTGRKLTPTHPLALRVAGYVAERFPPLTTALVVLAFFAAALFSALALWQPGLRLHLSWQMALGAAALVLVFFHLRLFDEFKDSGRDQRAHPGRLLSRGVVTLPLLGRVLGVVLTLELALLLLIGPPPLLWYLALLTYSVAMRYEFGVGHWLQRRPLLYATSHMAITPLMALYVVSFAAQALPFRSAVLPIVALSTCATVTFELGRKSWAPTQEHIDADSYSRLWGTTRAGLAVLTAILASLLAGLWLCCALQLAWTAMAVVVVVALVAAGCALHYVQSPTVVTARRLGLATSLLLLLELSTIAVAVAAARGITLVSGGAA